MALSFDSLLEELDWPLEEEVLPAIDAVPFNQNLVLGETIIDCGIITHKTPTLEVVSPDPTIVNTTKLCASNSLNVQVSLNKLDIVQQAMISSGIDCEINSNDFPTSLSPLSLPTSSGSSTAEGTTEWRKSSTEPTERRFRKAPKISEAIMTFTHSEIENYVRNFPDQNRPLGSVLKQLVQCKPVRTTTIDHETKVHPDRPCIETTRIVYVRNNELESSIRENPEENAKSFAKRVYKRYPNYKKLATRTTVLNQSKKEVQPDSMCFVDVEKTPQITPCSETIPENMDIFNEEPTHVQPQPINDQGLYDEDNLFRDWTGPL